MYLTLQQTKHRILPEIERVRLKKYGVTFEKGGFMYPDCGHRPVDFLIIGFGWVGWSREWLCAYGYHIAVKPRRYMVRGGWHIDDVAINEAVNPALDELIDRVNAIFPKEPICLAS